jgi:hypothetical protein
LFPNFLNTPSSGGKTKVDLINSRTLMTPTKPQSTSTPMIHLNRRSTKAAEESAKAAQRIAAAQEKNGKLLLEYLFALENADILAPPTQDKAEPPRSKQPRR